MNSIGSPHAVHLCAPKAFPVSTPDRILLIIGNFEATVPRRYASDTDASVDKRDPAASSG